MLRIKVSGQFEMEGVTLFRSFDDPSLYHYIPYRWDFRRNEVDEQMFRLILYRYPIEMMDRVGGKGGGFCCSELEFILPEEKLETVQSALEDKVGGGVNLQPVPITTVKAKMMNTARELPGIEDNCILLSSYLDQKEAILLKNTVLEKPESMFEYLELEIDLAVPVTVDLAVEGRRFAGLSQDASSPDSLQPIEITWEKPFALSEADLAPVHKRAEDHLSAVNIVQKSPQEWMHMVSGQMASFYANRFHADQFRETILSSLAPVISCAGDLQVRYSDFAETTFRYVISQPQKVSRVDESHIHQIDLGDFVQKMVTVKVIAEISHLVESGVKGIGVTVEYADKRAEYYFDTHNRSKEFRFPMVDDSREYRYQYEVFLADGGSFRSSPITSAHSMLVISPSLQDIGI